MLKVKFIKKIIIIIRLIKLKSIYNFVLIFKIDDLSKKNFNIVNLSTT